MEIIRAREIRLMWDGNYICAMIGDDLQTGAGGFGSTVSLALKDLAKELEKRSDKLTVWVPHPARQYREDGLLKADCPECGRTRIFTGSDRIIAFICDDCGLATDVTRNPTE